MTFIRHLTGFPLWVHLSSQLPEPHWHLPGQCPAARPSTAALPTTPPAAVEKKGNASWTTGHLSRLRGVSGSISVMSLQGSLGVGMGDCCS